MFPEIKFVLSHLFQLHLLCQNLTSQAEADPRGGKAGLPGGSGRDGCQHRPRGPSQVRRSIPEPDGAESFTEEKVEEEAAPGQEGPAEPEEPAGAGQPRDRGQGIRGPETQHHHQPRGPCI